MPLVRPAVLVAVPAVLLGLAACGTTPHVARGAAPSSSRAVTPRSDVPAPPVKVRLPSTGPAAASPRAPRPASSPPRPAAGGVASVAPGPASPAPAGAAGTSPAALPPVAVPPVAVPPVAVPSAAPPATAPADPSTAGPDLRSVAWQRRPVPGVCGSPRRSAPVYADLDRDGRPEAALGVRCTAADGSESARVLVYGGSAAAPQLLGEALPAAEHGRLQAVEARDVHLIVADLGWSGADRSGNPDILVTSRWTLAGGQLHRTDRYVDPADVLTADDQ